MSKRDEYIEELKNTLTEFVGEAGSGADLTLVSSLPESCYISQLIIGDYTAATAIYASEDAMLAFAAAYAQFEVSTAERDEIIADFLNMLNGRFAVRLSNTSDTECSLSVPIFTPPEKVKLKETTSVIPFDFSFGKINFVFSE